MLTEYYEKELKNTINKKEEALKKAKYYNNIILKEYLKIAEYSILDDNMYDILAKLLKDITNELWEFRIRDNNYERIQEFVSTNDNIFISRTELDEYTNNCNPIIERFYEIEEIDEGEYELACLFNAPYYIKDFIDYIIIYRIENNIKCIPSSVLDNLYNYFIANYNMETREIKREIKNDKILKGHVRKLKK